MSATFQTPPRGPIRNNSSYFNGKAVTPSDTVDLPNPGCIGLWIGGPGTVKVAFAGGGIETFAGVAAGTEIKAEVARVYATGTSATLILALY